MQWFAVREEEQAPDASVAGGKLVALPFRIIEKPSAEERFQTCVPIYTLKAAAGDFSQSQAPEPDGWAEFATKRPFRQDHFVAQIIGKSMEPRIPDGSWCLFTRTVAGSRHGRILIVQHHQIADPELGGSYTIKRYERLPQDAGDSRELAGVIVLKPLNPAFEAISISEGEDQVLVIAEFLEVIGGSVQN